MDLLKKTNTMKTNNELIKEMQSGKNMFDVLTEERRNTTRVSHIIYADSVWIGAIESNYILALQEIISLRKDNERLKLENFNQYAELKREDLAQEAAREMKSEKVNGEGDE